MTTRVLRFGLALLVAMLGVPLLALTASAASTAALACPADPDAGPVQTTSDRYPQGATGSFDATSLAPGAGRAAVTSAAGCGVDGTISSAQCQDEPDFASTWDGAGTFSVTLTGTLALCEAVEFHVGSYSLDEPAAWNGESSLGDGATPQTEFDHQLIVFDVGAEPGTRSATVAAPACGPYQADLYRGARRTTIEASGHGQDFVRGGILAGATCAAPPTEPPTEPPTGPPTGAGVESEAVDATVVSATAAVDCDQDAVVLTLTNPGMSPAAVDFTVEDARYPVQAGESRAVLLPVADGAAYSVLVTHPAGSAAFAGVFDCSPGASTTNVAAGSAGSAGPSVPPVAATDAGPGAVLGERGAATPEASGVAGSAVRAAGAGSGIAQGSATGATGATGAVGGSGAAGTARAAGTAGGSGAAGAAGGSGALAVTGAPDLVTGSLAAVTLLAVGAGLVRLGRSRPRQG